MKIFLSLACICGAGLCFSQQQSKPIPAEDDQLQEQRQEWLYGLREYPKHSIPPGARNRAMGQLEKMLREAQTNRSAPQASTSQWTSIGPRAINGGGLPYASGRVSALAVDPRTPDTVYLGGADGGVWKSIDGGKNWTPLTDNQASLAIGALALDPTNPDVVYAATGDPDGYFGAGLLKSSDAGSTWTNIVGPFADSRIGGIAIHPTNGKLILIAKTSRTGTADGIYRSTDAGQTWTSVLTGSGFTVVMNASGIAYAALTSNGTLGGVYKSTDSGVTWAAANGSGNTALPFATSTGIRMAVAPSNYSLVYVSLADSNRNLMGIYKSLDGGGTWNKLTVPDYCTPQCQYSNTITVHPTNSNLFYAGGALDAYRTLDGGKTFTAAFGDNGSPHSDIVHVDEQSIAFSSDGGRVYLGTDGGVVSTSTFDQDSILWTSLNATLTLTQFYPGLSIHPTDTTIGFGGSQDNSVVKYSGSPTWDTTVCGDGGMTAIDYNNPSTVYVACTLAVIQKSTDGGNTFTSASTGLGPGPSAFISPLVMDPTNPVRLYFGTGAVNQTTNGATTWTPISPVGISPVNAIGVSASDPNTVYAGTQSGTLTITRNALSGTGATWTNRTNGLPNRVITQICVDPSNALIAVVSFSGFAANTPGTPGHVFRTTDGGVSWTDISGNLPDVPADDVVIDPDIPGTIYLGTDLGAFVTSNNGTAWSVLASGLPRVAVNGLKLHRQARLLRAATFGRGMWDLSVPAPNQNPLPVVMALSPAIATPGGAGFTLTISGTGFVSASTVQWNGLNRTATVVSSSQITVAVSASDIATAGTALVNVTSPLPGGGASNGLALTIGSSLPAPKLTAVSPASVTAGGAAYTLTVTGTGFVSGSTLNWNGSARVTTPLSSTKLSALITAADIATATTTTVTVTNPAPGGGTSNGLGEFVTGNSVYSTAAGAYWLYNGKASTTGVTAPLGGIWGVTLDATGNVYFTDHDNALVFKLTPAGVLTVLAGTGTSGSAQALYRLNSPSGVAFDPNGNLVVNDTMVNRVVRINADSSLTRVAGDSFGSSTYGGDGNPAATTSVGETFGVAFDSAGNMYLAETIYNRILKVDTTGKLSTFAGTGTQGYSGDGGAAAAATLTQPQGVAVDALGNVYIADTFNHAIRKVTTSGVISTVAGLGGPDGGGFAGDGAAATKARLELPRGVFLDPAGNIYIADSGNNRIRKVDISSGNISTIAGTGTGGFSGDGGPATAATVFNPLGGAADASGNIYIADTGNLRLRKVSGGVITTIAGNGGFKLQDGAAATANFNAPQGLAADASGNVYVADTGNHRVRKILTSGVVTTIAGNGAAGFSGDGGSALSASLNTPQGVAVDVQGNVYIADSKNNRLRKVTPAGAISTVAGGGTTFPTGLPTLSASSILLSAISSVTSDGANIYFAYNCAIGRLNSSATVTLLANGNCQETGDGPAATASISSPIAIAVDTNGNVFFGEGTKVRKIGKDGNITTVAGGGSTYTADGSLGTLIQLNQVGGMAADGAGNLFFTDSLHDDRVYLLSPSGNLTTVAGSAEFHDSVGIALAQPHGIAVDQSHNLFVADTGNDRVVEITSISTPGAGLNTVGTGVGPTPPTITAQGLVNGASFAADNIVSPWSIASIFGSGMSSGSGGAASLPLPTTLNQTQVLVNGQPAPIFYSSPTQVNFQVPVEAAGSTAQLAVSLQGAASTPVPMTLAPASPGIFIADPVSHQGAILNQDFSPNSASNPAAVGSVIQVFATGLGTTNPAVATGQGGASAEPYNRTTTTPVATFQGGLPGVVQFSAAAPGFIGLYQVNITVPRVPPTLTTVTLTLQIGGRTSNLVNVGVKQ